MEKKNLKILKNFLNDVYDFSGVVDFDELLIRRKNVNHNFEGEMSINKKMIQILPKTLLKVNDFNKLIIYWKESPDLEARALIESRMPAVLSKVNDFDKLSDYYKNAGSDEIRSLIKNQITQVLSGEEDFDKLFYYAKFSVSSVSALVYDRMVPVLQKIDDFNELVTCMNKRSPNHSTFRSLINERMVQFLAVALPKMNDFDELLSFWRAGDLDQEVRKPINDHMIQVLLTTLPEIKDLFKLENYFYKTIIPDTDYGFGQRALIKDQMARVLTEVSDFNLLFDYFEESTNNSDISGLIKRRIMECLAEVTSENLPDSFVKVVQGAKITFFFKPFFKEKVQELLSV